MTSSNTANRRANYGLDAPVVQRNLAFATFAALAAGVFGYATIGAQGWPSSAMSIGASSGISLAVMIWSSRIGKRIVARRMLKSVPWRGDEIVLDVGCGRGLATIGAAKQVTKGRVVGIDVWSTVDLSGNTERHAYANAQAEDVMDRVVFKTAEARDLPYDTATFDVALSMTAIHNISGKVQRAKAIDEMARVLRPGGRVAIFDILRTSEYRRRLQQLGFKDVRQSGLYLLWFMPGRLVTATAPVG